MNPISVVQWVLLLFWAIWYTTVFCSNLIDFLREMAYIPKSIHFYSANYQQVRKALSSYTESQWVSVILFVGVILWQLLIAVLFWISVFTVSIRVTVFALTAGIGLFAAFMIADEILKLYKTQTIHLMLLIAQVVSVLVFR